MTALALPERDAERFQPRLITRNTNRAAIGKRLLMAQRATGKVAVEDGIVTQAKGVKMIHEVYS